MSEFLLARPCIQIKRHKRVWVLSNSLTVLLRWFRNTAQCPSCSNTFNSIWCAIRMCMIYGLPNNRLPIFLIQAALGSLAHWCSINQQVKSPKTSSAGTSFKFHWNEGSWQRQRQLWLFCSSCIIILQEQQKQHVYVWQFPSEINPICSDCKTEGYHWCFKFR